mgnify:CR=1 FL=1|jgi:hypothetical protein
MKKHSLGSMLVNLIGAIVLGAIAIWMFSGSDPDSIQWLMVPLGKVVKFVFIAVFTIPFFLAVAGNFFNQHKF